MSVTVVVTRHPRKLLGTLKSRYSVQNGKPGIYTVEGDTSPTQILVSDELPEKDNFWLTNLRNDLTEEQAERVYTAAKGRTGLDAYIYAIAKANIKTTKELFMKRKEEIFLSKEIDAHFHERLTVPRVAETGRNMVLTVLRARFGKVTKAIEKEIRQISDPIALDSWAAQAATCQSLEEFAEALR
jgi:hypothetical protein